MSTFIDEDRLDDDIFYTAVCSACDWEGAPFPDDIYSAHRQAVKHEGECPKQPDTRTPYRKYQDELDGAAEAALASIVERM